ncbi:hypothetical protein DY926_08480 [Komagataeibacter melaceti]|uniref:Uncharacterized protein n=1 Tax=Komagataeibacter melaceti TaxID=2766577 RepID=A0A371Z0H9_9PROT|nr:DUF6587 family protein [Komagataeibacter melaceti]RFD19988.1 hypothetical protein DY926_08480 [Komagataeibacter melaceti]
MEAGTLLQTVLACGIVAACALYWAGRLFPTARQKGWGALAALLRRCHAPQALVRHAARRGLPRAAGGCGGCSACSGKNRPPES